MRILLALLLLATACKKKEEAPAAPPPAADPAPAPAPAAEPAPAPAPAPAAGNDCKDGKDNKGLPACEAACNGGDANACFVAGDIVIVETDDGDEADKKALPLFQKGCDGGSGLACQRLAAFHTNGLAGLTKDEAKAKELLTKAVPLLDKACEAKDRVSCAMLGDAYDAGSGVTPDKAKAMDAWKKGCDLGSPGACEHAKKQQ